MTSGRKEKKLNIVSRYKIPAEASEIATAMTLIHSFFGLDSLPTYEDQHLASNQQVHSLS